MAHWLKLDVNVVRLLTVLAAFFTGGTAVIVYLALWLLLPTAASTASDTGGVIQENLNDIGHRFRGFTGGAHPTSGPANPTHGAPGGNPQGQGQVPSNGGANGGARSQSRPSNMALVLIGIGALLLLLNFGVFSIFRVIHWGTLWPLLLIALGVIILSRRRW